MKTYALAVAAILIVGCGDDDSSSSSSNNNASGNGGANTGGTGGSGLVAAGGDGGMPASGGMGGAGPGGGGGMGGEGPPDVAPFSFELGGEDQVPEELEVDTYTSQSPGQKNHIFELKAIGSEAGQPFSFAPRLEVDLDVGDIVEGATFTLDDEVSYHYAEPNAIKFSDMQGTMTVYEDGWDGVFIAVIEGTIVVSNVPKPAYIEIHQEVEPWEQ